MSTDLLAVLVATGIVVKLVVAVMQTLDAASYEWQRARAVRHYRARPCQGRAWRRACPNATSQDIRRFLRIVTASFGFRRHRILSFAPDDRVMDLFRACAPGTYDQMELETMTSLIKHAYGTNLQKMWHAEITFGELFLATRSNSD